MESSDELVGQIISRYRIIEKLGGGELGVGAERKEVIEGRTYAEEITCTPGQPVIFASLGEILDRRDSKAMLPKC